MNLSNAHVRVYYLLIGEAKVSIALHRPIKVRCSSQIGQGIEIASYSRPIFNRSAV